jgi:hypothetical protein
MSAARNVEPMETKPPPPPPPTTTRSASTPPASVPDDESQIPAELFGLNYVQAYAWSKTVEEIAKSDGRTIAPLAGRPANIAAIAVVARLAVPIGGPRKPKRQRVASESKETLTLTK